MDGFRGRRASPEEAADTIMQEIGKLFHHS